MAHTKSGGSTANVRDSQPKYLGIKLADGQHARPGTIIVRQRGSRVLPGKGVRQGNDYTLYAVSSGIVKFSEKRKTRFDGARTRKKVASVV